MLIDLGRLIIDKIEKYYVNFNWRKRENKKACLVKGRKEKKIDKKMWQKDRQQKIVRNI